MKIFSEILNKQSLVNKPKPIFKKHILNNPSTSISNIKDQPMISIMTWNILASGYTTPSAYYYVKPEYLEENYRLNSISNDILFNNCDIVCLQEVEKRNHTQYFQSENFSQYDSIYEKRPGLTCDGLSVLYKKNLFKLKEYQLIKLNEITNDNIKQSLKNYRLTNNIAHICILEPLLEKIKNKMDFVIVTNLHLHWDPNKENIKYFQMYEIIKRLNSVYKRIKDISERKMIGVFLCGDFNSLPNSNVINLAMNKLNIENAPKELSKLYSEVYNESSQYKNFELKDSNQGEDYSYLTNIKPDFSGKLDYIFYSNNYKFNLLESSYFDINNFKSENAIPNSFHASDHIYLISKFYL
jgi:mRNA deadenylase 3'-5' endonuclease subunit Ccr4